MRAIGQDQSATVLRMGIGSLVRRQAHSSAEAPRARLRSEATLPAGETIPNRVSAWIAAIETLGRAPDEGGGFSARGAMLGSVAWNWGDASMRTLLPVAASAILAVLSAAALADDKSDCRNNGNRDLQIKGCTALIERDAKDAMAYHNRGIAYQFKGDLDRAIADYNKAIELRPSYARAYESRGSAYASKGVFTNAVADVTKATELARKKAPPGPKAAAAKPPNTKVAAKPAKTAKASKSGSEKQAADDTWQTSATKSDF
jgi:tetratricopeptide (TPR) repeat protein